MDLQQVIIAIIIFIRRCIEEFVPMQINRTQSQILLINAEEFSVQWASTFEISENRTIAAENIGT